DVGIDAALDRMHVGWPLAMSRLGGLCPVRMLWRLPVLRLRALCGAQRGLCRLGRNLRLLAYAQPHVGQALEKAALLPLLGVDIQMRDIVPARSDFALCDRREILHRRHPGPANDTS